MRPLSSDVHRVVERLEDCIRRNGCEADLEVEMAEARVLACRHDEEPGSICGSVACVGGWYALVVHQRGEAEGTLFTRGGEEPSTCEVCVRGAPAGDQVLGFEDGADLMALHLGFDSQSSLTKWAHEHPDLWDNAHGAERFLSAEAFGLDWCAPSGFGTSSTTGAGCGTGLSGSRRARRWTRRRPAGRSPGATTTREGSVMGLTSETVGSWGLVHFGEDFDRDLDREAHREAEDRETAACPDPGDLVGVDLDDPGW